MAALLSAGDGAAGATASGGADGAEPAAAAGDDDDGSLAPSPVAALGTLQCLVGLAASAQVGIEA